MLTISIGAGLAAAFMAPAFGRTGDVSPRVIELDERLVFGTHSDMVLYEWHGGDFDAISIPPDTFAESREPRKLHANTVAMNEPVALDP